MSIMQYCPYITTIVPNTTTRLGVNVTGKVTPPATFCQKKDNPANFEVVPVCPSRGTRQTRLPHSRAVVVRQPCTVVYSRTRSEATKPPFFKRGFGGNVNISYYTQMRPFSGLRLPHRGKAKGGQPQACLKGYLPF